MTAHVPTLLEGEGKITQSIIICIMIHDQCLPICRSPIHFKFNSDLESPTVRQGRIIVVCMQQILQFYNVGGGPSLNLKGKERGHDQNGEIRVRAHAHSG